MSETDGPMDPDAAQERLDELGEHIEATKRELSDVLHPQDKERFVDSGAISRADDADRTDLDNKQDDQTIAP